MPWKQSSEMDERIRYVVQAERQDETLSELSQEFGIHRSTGWRWRKRLEQVGRIEDLAEHSRRAGRGPSETCALVQQRILELRGKHGWGGLKLAALLKREGMVVSAATVNRVLARHGAIRPPASHRPAGERFEQGAADGA